MAKRRITQTTPSDSLGFIVFWRQKLLVGDLHSRWNFRSNWPPPLFEHNDFDQYLLIVPQPCERAINVQLALIGIWQRTFQRAIDEPCTLPPSHPKGGTKRDFVVFASKIQLLSKEVCYKVSLCENFQRQLVATSFLYITVHKRIAVDVPFLSPQARFWGERGTELARKWMAPRFRAFGAASTPWASKSRRLRRLDVVPTTFS